MILKTSFIVGLVAGALVIGVQVASARPQDASDRANPGVGTPPDAFERAVLARQLSNRLGTVSGYPDVVERAVSAKQRELGLGGTYYDAHQRSYVGGTAFASTPDAFERAVATAQRDITAGSTRLDAHQRTQVSQSGFASAPDAFERAVASELSTRRLVVGDSHGRIDLPGTPGSVPTVASSRQIEWPQIGIGFGVGILLALGLWLAVRLTVRPLAH